MFDKCKNESIQVMLVPYVEKALAAVNCAEVEKHLQECEECRQRVSVIRDVLKVMGDVVRSGYTPSLEPHPAPRLLFSYALERRFITAQDGRAVHAHVMGCPICKAEVEQLRDLDKEYQQKNITVGTSDLLPALKPDLVKKTPPKEAKLPSEDVVENRIPELKQNPISCEDISPILSLSDRHQSIVDYYHDISHRIPLPRIGATLVVILLVCYGLSLVFSGDDSAEVSESEISKSVADKTIEAISTLPSPSSSTLPVILKLEEDGQLEILCDILRKNNIEFEENDGNSIRVSVEDSSKVQQLWNETVKNSNEENTSDSSVAQSGEAESNNSSPALDSLSDYSDSETSPLDSESSEVSSHSSDLNVDVAPSVSNYVEEVSGGDGYSSSSQNSSTQESSAPEPSYSTPATVEEPATSKRSNNSAPKQILKKTKSSSASSPVLETYRPSSRNLSVKSNSSSSSKSSTSGSIRRPQPKPGFITLPSPTSATTATESEVNTKDIPPSPHFVSTHSTPALGTSVYDGSPMGMTPTPSSVYESSDEENNSSINSWSNDL